MNNEEFEKKHQGKWNLHEITAAEFLQNVATLFESQAPSDKESWLEVYFEDAWGEQQVMRLWPAQQKGRMNEQPIH